MSKSGNTPTSELVRDIRTERENGKIIKRFKDDFFALDLVRILYDDSEATDVKIELLVALEEYGHLGITDDSVDQIVTSLLDIHHQIMDKGDDWPVNCQLLSTCTCLVIQFDLLNSNVKLCEMLIKELVTIVSSKVNQPDSHRLRSCACQCLIHLEEFNPGLLHVYHDDISQLSRQERSHVFQDYALLAAKILESVLSYTDQSTDFIGQIKQKGIQKQLSYEPHDIRQTAAYIVENLPLLTRSGTLRVIQSLAKLSKLFPQVSPMIFKPTMLHQMSTMSCVVFHTVLYLQKEFENEILNSKEEYDLLQRLCLMCDHPCLNNLHKLLAIQWAQYYNMDISGTVQAHQSIVYNHRCRFYPSVFDSVDCQLGKLCMTSLLGHTDDDTDGVETSILLGSLGCLHKMVWHTGSSLAARTLFKALYYIYTKHNNPSFSKDIQRFVRGLISEFAHFIPHSIDFADSVHEISSDDQVFVDTLILLHQQVVMATEEQIYESYQFYLQIMKKAASRQEIDQKPALKFLSYVVKNASYIADSGWKLGHRILDICKVIIMSHGTETCFIEKTITNSQDSETYHYSTYSYIINAALILPAMVLLGNALKQNHRIKCKILPYLYTYHSWLLASGVLSCVLDIMNFFDSLTGGEDNEKFGRTCYYIYVLKGTFVTFTAFSILALFVDHLLTCLRVSKEIQAHKDKSIQAHAICVSLMCFSFILNNMAQITQKVNFSHIKKCWKGNAYEGHTSVAALYSIILYMTVLSLAVILVILNCLVYVWKSNSQLTVLVPVSMLAEIQNGAENVTTPQELMEHGRGNVTHLDILGRVEEMQGDSSGSILPELECFELKSTNDMARRRSSDGYEILRYGSKERSHGSYRTLLERPNNQYGRKRYKSDTEIQSVRCPRKKLNAQVIEALEQFFVADTTGALFQAFDMKTEMDQILMKDDDDDEDDGGNDAGGLDDGLEGEAEVESVFVEHYENDTKAHQKLLTRDGNRLKKFLSSSDSCNRIVTDKISTPSGSESHKKLRLRLSDPCSKRDSGHVGAMAGIDNLLFSSDGTNVSIKETKTGNEVEGMSDKCTVTAVLENPRVIVSDCDAPDSQISHCQISHHVSPSECTLVYDIGKINTQDHVKACLNLNQEFNANVKLEGMDNKTKPASIEMIEIPTSVTYDDLSSHAISGDSNIDVSSREDDKNDDKDTVRDGDVDSITSDFTTVTEKLSCREYCKKFLLKPYKDCICLIATYIICLIPQVVLDIYRILLDEPSTKRNFMDGFLSVISETGISMFFVSLSVTFILRFRKGRVIKTHV
ncbi:endosomal transport [Mactra antiquata]